MQKIKLTLILILGFVTTVTNAQWISLDKNKSHTQNKPKISVLNSDSESTVLNVAISGFAINAKNIDGADYHEIDLLTDSNSIKVGSPELPLVSNLIAVPDNAVVSVEIIETGAVTIYENIDIAPARESWFEGDEETSYNKNRSIYNADEMYPSKQVSLGTPAVFRDYRVVCCSVTNAV